jgi:uncharacterized protein YbjT (DUF2867 family)
MPNHNICILGGAGFVGGHLVTRLAREGHHLKVLDRHPERRSDLRVIAGVELVPADVGDPGTLDKEFEGFDVVINLIGILNEKGHDGKGFRQAHVELPRKVVDACRRHGIRRLLHMSALGADAAYGPSHYQRTKGEGENLVHARADLDVTSFRPSVIFGPGDSFFNRFGKLLKLAPVFPLAGAEARFQPVYVGDVVEAYARAMDNPATFGQRYELCGPHVYTLRELVEYTARVLELKRVIIPLSDRLARVQANVLEYFPGKPFSRDNYLSLKRDNICSGDFPGIFEIEPTSVESMVPSYLGKK